MTKYVTSTMTSSVGYCIYEQNTGLEPRKQGMPALSKLPKILKKIIIRGGAGIPSETSGSGDMVKYKNSGVPIWTAHGVVTAVKDEDMELLLDNVVFKKHLEKGYVRVVDTDIRGNNKAIMREVKSMEEKDQFAQLNDETFKDMINQKMKIVSADKNDNFDDIPRN